MKEGKKVITRRDFLVGAAGVVVGAALGSAMPSGAGAEAARSRVV